MASHRKGLTIPIDARWKIMEYKASKMPVTDIVKTLKEKHDVTVCRKTIYNVLLQAKKTGYSGKIDGRKTSSPKLLYTLHKKIIDFWITKNPEMTSSMISRKFFRCFGLELSASHIRSVRQKMGWQCKQTSYCQLISQKNKKERLKWCLEAYSMKEDFRNVIFTDESTVELRANGNVHFYKSSQDSFDKVPSKRPKPKHAYKVNVWGGISYEGRCSICIFTGIMDSKIYQQILENNLVPFAKEVFPDGFRLYQDNDSKHVSKSTQEWFKEKGLSESVMKTPASSPDLNPIENVWASLKHCLSTKVKPRTVDELVDGIRSFWENLTAGDCHRYINHIHKVIPEVIINDGAATRF